MNNYSSRVRRIRKEILELESRVKKLYLQRRALLRNLHRANRDYNLGKITYSEYSRIWESNLQGLSVEEATSRYDAHIRTLESRKSALKKELRELRADRDKASKALSISLSLVLVFGLIAVFSAFGTEIGDITGFAGINATTQEVTINAYYAIDLSNDTIDFGSGLEHGLSNINATLNYNGSDKSEYYIESSSDSNVDIKIYINGTDFTGSGGSIGASNMSWACNDTTDATWPSIDSDSSLSTSRTLTTTYFNLTPGSKAYYRYWIDIPAGTPPGFYNNTLTFYANRSS